MTGEPDNTTIRPPVGRLGLDGEYPARSVSTPDEPVVATKASNIAAIAQADSRKAAETAAKATEGRLRAEFEKLLRATVGRVRAEAKKLWRSEKLRQAGRSLGGLNRAKKVREKNAAREKLIVAALAAGRDAIKDIAQDEKIFGPTALDDLDQFADRCAQIAKIQSRA